MAKMKRTKKNRVLNRVEAKNRRKKNKRKNYETSSPSLCQKCGRKPSQRRRLWLRWFDYQIGICKARTGMESRTVRVVIRATHAGSVHNSAINQPSMNEKCVQSIDRDQWIPLDRHRRAMAIKFKPDASPECRMNVTFGNTITSAFSRKRLGKKKVVSIFVQWFFFGHSEHLTSDR